MKRRSFFGAIAGSILAIIPLRTRKAHPSLVDDTLQNRDFRWVCDINGDGQTYHAEAWLDKYELRQLLGILFRLTGTTDRANVPIEMLVHATRLHVASVNRKWIKAGHETLDGANLVHCRPLGAAPNHPGYMSLIKLLEKVHEWSRR